MPYLGRGLEKGNYLKLDDISSQFDGSKTTFNLTVGGSAHVPGSSYSLLVSLSGIVQEGEAAYTLDQNEITFAAAPQAADDCFIISLGTPLGIGVPSNGTVNGTQLAKPLNYDNFFHLDHVNDRVGIGTSIPIQSLDVYDGNIAIRDPATASQFLGFYHNRNVLKASIDKTGNNLTFENVDSGIIDYKIGGSSRVSIGSTGKIFFATDDNTYFYRPGADTLAFVTAGEERLRITSTGVIQLSNLYSSYTSGTATRFSLYNDTNNHYGLHVGGNYDLNYNAGGSTLSGKGEHRFHTAATERLRINSSGLVGIGTDLTTTPSSVLTIAPHTTGGRNISIYTNGTVGNKAGLFFNATPGTGNLAEIQAEYKGTNSGDLIFNTSMVEALRINSSGLVGIGTDSISQPLTIRRSSTDQAEFGVRLEYQNLTGPTATSAAMLVNGNGLQFRNYNSNRTFIFNNGHVGVGTLVPTAPRFSSTVSGLLHLRGTKPSLYISESDNHDPDGKERAIYAGLSGGSAFIGSNGDDGLQFLTGNGSTGAAVQITQDKYVHFGNTGHGTTAVGGQGVTGNDFAPYVKILSNTANSWSMQIRNDTNTRSNGIFLRAGNNNTSTYTLYATGTNEHYPSFVVRGDGNVGIGSSSPAERLQIFGNAEFNAYDSASGSGGYYSPKGLIIGNAFDNGVGNACTDDRNAIVWQERGLDLDFGANNQFRVKLKYSGEVGIGHSAPNALLHLGVSGNTGSAVGNETNPALQIGNTSNYRFAIHTTSEGAIIGNKNGDDGILFKTKLGNNGVDYGNAMRLHSRGYRESAGYHYGPWTFTDNTLKSTITIGDPGDGDYTIVKFILTIMDSSYRQNLFAGEYAVFASNANGGPGVVYQIAKIWDKIGSGNWSGGSVTVTVTSGGAVQVQATNNNNDAGGEIYCHILDVIGDRNGSTIASITS